MAKKISDNFRAIVRVTRICADICGADVFDPGYRVNWRSKMVFVIINACIVFLIYTGYTGYRAEGDWKIILQVLSIGGGTLIQGYVKFVNFIRHQTNIRFLLEDLHAIYDEYELKHSDYRVYLNRGLKILSNLRKLCAFITVLMVLGMAMVTLVYSLVFNTRILIVYGVMPGVDPSTEMGFVVTVTLQLSFIGVGGFGFYAGDMGFFTPISQIIMLKDLVKCKFQDLNEILRDEPDNKRASMDALKDIIKFHQRYLRFLQITQHTFFWVILIQISTYSTGIISTLFCVFLGEWPGGYVYLIYCFVMMYVYCGIGTLVEIANSGLIDSCYNDVQWYDLSVPEKKMLRTMLMNAQNTHGLTVGSVAPLSMNTSLQVTKTIYSIAMMLLNSAE